MQELSTRSLHRTPIWDISIQDLRISPDLLGLFTGALYKISSQDLHEKSLCKSSLRSPGTPGPPKSLNRSSLQDLFTRPLWEISVQELSTRSLHKTSMRDLNTRALYKISSQDPHRRHLHTRALYKISSQGPIWDISLQAPLISLDLLGLLTGALYKISSQDLHEKSLCKSSLRSPGIPGPPRSPHRSSLQDLFTRPLWALYKSSLQDLFTRPLWEISIQELSTRSLLRTPIWDISIQDLRISLDLLGLFTGDLHKISSQDLYERSLYKSSLQDLFTRPLWETSKQELSTRSLHRTPYETSLYKLPWYPWTS